LTVGHDSDIDRTAIPDSQFACEFAERVASLFSAGHIDVIGLDAIPYLSLIGVGLLAYWPRFVAWREMTRMDGGYDNGDPRTQQALLQGMGARAMAAHHNSLEALPFFGLGVLAALQRGVGIHQVAALCVGFLVIRIVFILSYLHDYPTSRSLAFMAGAGICLILYGLAACGIRNLL
jgi:uncharacterized MAPEG superfamily protein